MRCSSLSSVGVMVFCLSQTTEGGPPSLGGSVSPRAAGCWHAGKGLCTAEPALPFSLSAPSQKWRHTNALPLFSHICSFPLLSSLGSEGHRKMRSSPSGQNRLGTDASSAVCLLWTCSHTSFQPRKPGAQHLTFLSPTDIYWFIQISSLCK